MMVPPWCLSTPREAPPRQSAPCQRLPLRQLPPSASWFTRSLSLVPPRTMSPTERCTTQRSSSLVTFPTSEHGKPTFSPTRTSSPGLPHRGPNCAARRKSLRPFDTTGDAPAYRGRVAFYLEGLTHGHRGHHCRERRQGGRRHGRTRRQHPVPLSGARGERHAQSVAVAIDHQGAPHPVSLPVAELRRPAFPGHPRPFD